MRWGMNVDGRNNTIWFIGPIFFSFLNWFLQFTVKTTNACPRMDVSRICVLPKQTNPERNFPKTSCRKYISQICFSWFFSFFTIFPLFSWFFCIFHDFFLSFFCFLWFFLFYFFVFSWVRLGSVKLFFFKIFGEMYIREMSI